jgi:FkbM family methyltransferase
MLESLRTVRGILRSLRIYYGDRVRAAAMDRLYWQFVQHGDLVFDVGAHVGDRVASFRRLGAHVVAVEPQPGLVRVLKLLYGRKADVAIEAAAVGRSAGTAGMMINADNPTVSTASADFVSAARGAPGWEAQRWTKTLRVPMTTLDALIAKHGMPAFIKIDVEGFERDVLAGAAETLVREPKPVWMVEIFRHFPMTGAVNDRFRDVFEVFWQAGYRSFNIGSDLRPVARDEIDTPDLGPNFLFRA